MPFRRLHAARRVRCSSHHCAKELIDLGPVGHAAHYCCRRRSAEFARLARSRLGSAGGLEGAAASRSAPVRESSDSVPRAENQKGEPSAHRSWRLAAAHLSPLAPPCSWLLALGTVLESRLAPRWGWRMASGPPWVFPWTWPLVWWWRARSCLRPLGSVLDWTPASEPLGAFGSPGHRTERWIRR